MNTWFLQNSLISSEVADSPECNLKEHQQLSVILELWVRLFESRLTLIHDLKVNQGFLLAR